MYIVNILLGLLVGYSIKMCILPTSIADSLALLFLGAALISSKYLENKKIEELNEAFKEELRAEVSGIRDNVTGLKMARSYGR
jgi:hypothetical protein